MHTSEKFSFSLKRVSTLFRSASLGVDYCLSKLCRLPWGWTGRTALDGVRAYCCFTASYFSTRLCTFVNLFCVIRCTGGNLDDVDPPTDSIESSEPFDSTGL